MKSIVYSSRRLDDTDGTGFSREFYDISLQSARHNRENDITGFLICTPKWYCQVLEGMAEDVDDLFDRISRDTRHYEAHILSERQIQKRTFANFSMGWKHQTIANRIHFLERGFTAEEQPLQSQSVAVWSLAQTLCADAFIASQA